MFHFFRDGLAFDDWDASSGDEKSGNVVDDWDVAPRRARSTKSPVKPSKPLLHSLGVAVDDWADEPTPTSQSHSQNSLVDDFAEAASEVMPQPQSSVMTPQPRRQRCSSL